MMAFPIARCGLTAAATRLAVSASTLAKSPAEGPLFADLAGTAVACLVG
jgi:hypothetical protein